MCNIRLMGYSYMKFGPCVRVVVNTIKISTWAVLLLWETRVDGRMDLLLIRIQHLLYRGFHGVSAAVVLTTSARLVHVWSGPFLPSITDSTVAIYAFSAAVCTNHPNEARTAHVRVLSWHTPGSGDTTAADPAAAAEAAGAAKDVVDAIRQLLDCTPQGPDDSDVDKIVKQFLAVRSGAVIAVL